jgi:hypothetical protein
MDLNGNDIAPSAEEQEALARRFHPKFTWKMLNEDERNDLLDEWRHRRRNLAIAPSQPKTTTRAVSEADAMRMLDAVQTLVKMQPMAAKASAHLAVRTVGRVLRPLIGREKQQRAELQRDLSLMRREWAEKSRRLDDLLGGLLAELCLHKRDENDARAERLDELEERVDAAIADLARR